PKARRRTRRAAGRCRRADGTASPLISIMYANVGRNESAIFQALQRERWIAKGPTADLGLGLEHDLDGAGGGAARRRIEDHRAHRVDDAGRAERRHLLVLVDLHVFRLPAGVDLEADDDLSFETGIVFQAGLVTSAEA